MAQEGVYRSCQVVRGPIRHPLLIKTLRLVLFSRDHLSIYALHGEPLFFQQHDGPIFPTLKLLHQCRLGWAK